MQLTSLCFTLLLSRLTSGLPVDGAPNRNLVPRSKSYLVVNVDGGSSTQAAQGATTVTDDRTKTVQVTDAASTITTTDTITATVVPAPAPAVSSGSTSSSSRPASASTTSSTLSPSSQISSVPTSTHIPTSTLQSPVPTLPSEATPETSLVTVTITEGPAPTEWYDNGLWHTRYPVKTKWD